jgi:hypothetical protein
MAGERVTKTTLDWIIHEAAPADITRWHEAGCPLLPEPLPNIDRLAITKAQAGQLLGDKSVDWIEKYVLPHVKTVKVSRSVLIPRSELLRWVDDNSDWALP